MAWAGLCPPPVYLLLYTLSPGGCNLVVDLIKIIDVQVSLLGGLKTLQEV